MKEQRDEFQRQLSLLQEKILRLEEKQALDCDGSTVAEEKGMLSSYWLSSSWRALSPIRNFARGLRGLPPEHMPEPTNHAQCIEAIDAVCNSISWNITGPLRAVGIIWRRLAAKAPVATGKVQSQMSLLPEDADGISISSAEDSLDDRAYTVPRGSGELYSRGLVNPQFVTVNTTASIGQTRDCLDPWRQPLVRSNGDVYPCCWFYASLGNLKEDGFAEIMNGPSFQALRRELLTGNLRPACSACPSRSITTPDRLISRLHADE